MLLTDILREYYKQNHKSIKLPITSLELPIEECYVRLALVEAKTQEQHTKQSLHVADIASRWKNHNKEIIRTYGDIYQPTKEIELPLLFKENPNNKSIRNIVIGRAGIGKSTFCKFLLYQWTHQKKYLANFQAIYWIPLRYLINYSLEKKNVYNSEDIAQFIYYVLNKQTSLSSLANTISVATIAAQLKAPEQQVFLILDGYDEINTLLYKQGSQLKKPIGKFLETLLKQPYYLLTSRPYAISQGEWKIPQDHYYEILGFTNADIPLYVHKIMTWKKNTIKKNKATDSQALLKFLRNNPSIWGVAHIPINLSLICALCDPHKFEEGEFTTLSKIYQKLIATLNKRYLKKQYQLRVRELQANTIETICLPIMQFLGELAFQGLQENVLLFEYRTIHRLISKHEKGLTDFLKTIYNRKGEKFAEIDNQAYLMEKIMDPIIKAGFLNIIQETDEVECRLYYFLHLTFQEYFAAYHIARYLENAKDNKNAFKLYKKFVKNHLKDGRYEIVNWFLAGFLKDKHLQKFFDLFNISNLKNFDKNIHKIIKNKNELFLALRCLEEGNLAEISQKSLLLESCKKLGEKILCSVSASTEIYGPTVYYLRMNPNLIRASGLLGLLKKIKNAESEIALHQLSAEDPILSLTKIIGEHSNDAKLRNQAISSLTLLVDKNNQEELQEITKILFRCSLEFFSTRKQTAMLAAESLMKLNTPLGIAAFIQHFFRGDGDSSTIKWLIRLHQGWLLKKLSGVDYDINDQLINYFNDHSENEKLGVERSDIKCVVLGAGDTEKARINIKFALEKLGYKLEDIRHALERGDGSYRGTIIVDNVSCFLEIVDAAGIEQFTAMRDLYIHKANVCIICFSLTSSETFEDAKNIYEQILRIWDIDADALNVPIILVGTKKHLTKERQVSYRQADTWADEHGMRYLECSGETGAGITDVFIAAIKVHNRSSEAFRELAEKKVQAIKKLLKSTAYLVNEVEEHFIQALSYLQGHSDDQVRYRAVKILRNLNAHEKYNNLDIYLTNILTEDSSVNAVSMKQPVPYEEAIITNDNSYSSTLLTEEISMQNDKVIKQYDNILQVDRELIESNNIFNHIVGQNWQSVDLINAIVHEDASTFLSIIDELDSDKLEARDANDNTGLHVAVLKNNTAAIQAYIEKALVDDEPNKFGLTPLHLAVIANDADNVVSLLRSNASATIGSRWQFPLVEKGFVTLSTLILAILFGRDQSIKAIYRELKEQHKLDDKKLLWCDEIGNVLHVAVISCVANTLELLLTDPELNHWAKGFLEKPNAEGETPLAYAAKRGILPAIDWLVKAGANINAQNNAHGRTALHYAVLGAQPTAVYNLIQLGANVHLFSNEERKERTPLQLARKLEKNKENDREQEKQKNRFKTIIKNLRNEAVIKAQSQGLGTTVKLIRRNLVIQGGGAKGLAYMGALAVLEKEHIVKELYRIGGTSAGAITALCLALNFSAEQIEEALTHLTVEDLLGDYGHRLLVAKSSIKTWLQEMKKNLNDPHWMKKTKGVGQALSGAFGHLPDLFEFLKLGIILPADTGVSDGKALQNWLKALIGNKLKRDLENKASYTQSDIFNYTNNLTFGRLRELVSHNLGYKHLYVFATDITDKKIVDFNSEDGRWDSINVIEAVCASAALPGAFAPRNIKVPNAQDRQLLEDHFFVDGGLVRNKPVDYFDEMKFHNPYMDHRWRWQRMTNWQTFALCLEEGKDPSLASVLNDITVLNQEIESIGASDLIERLWKIFYNAENLIQAMQSDIRDRTITIYVQDLKTTEFDAVENPARLAEIRAWGREPTEAFLKRGQPKQAPVANNNASFLMMQKAFESYSPKPDASPRAMSNLEMTNDYWYNETDINRLLKIQLVDDKEAHIMAAQFPLLAESRGEAAQLFKDTLLKGLKKTQATGIPSLLPVNLIKIAALDQYGLPIDRRLHGNHWVLIVIKYNKEVSRLEINYIDPFGNDQADDINVTHKDLTVLNTYGKRWEDHITSIVGLIAGACYETSFKPEVIVRSLVQQENGSDCGPLLIANAVAEVRNNSRTRVNTLSLRKEHASLLQSQPTTFTSNEDNNNKNDSTKDVSVLGQQLSNTLKVNTNNSENKSSATNNIESSLNNYAPN